MPETEFRLFQRHLQPARQMVATYTVLESRLTRAIDVTDLLRSALVQGVSAFDHFIHEEIRVRMHAVHSQPTEAWPDAFSRFSVSLATVDTALRGLPGWLDQEIREQHGHVSFQHPDKIAGAFKLVLSRPLWPAVAADLGLDAAAVRRRLQLIVDRRNKIAHEADFDPTPPASRYPISRAMVDDSLDFLDLVASSIHQIR